MSKVKPITEWRLYRPLRPLEWSKHHLAQRWSDDRVRTICKASLSDRNFAQRYPPNSDAERDALWLGISHNLEHNLCPGCRRAFVGDMFSPITHDMENMDD